MAVSRWLFALSVALVWACSRERSAPVAVVVDAAAPPAAAATPAVVASAVVVDAGCGHSLLVPDACLEPHRDLDLGNDQIAAWFSARGVKVPGYTFERCREVKFAEEAVLVCVDMKPTAIEPSMGLAGPVEYRYDLDVRSVRAGKRVEYLRVPFAFGTNGGDLDTASEMIFSASFTVDATGIDLVAPRASCNTALENLGPYWNAEMAKLRGNESIAPALKQDLLHAAGDERASDGERISAICQAAGRYVRGADGRFAKR